MIETRITETSSTGMFRDIDLVVPATTLGSLLSVVSASALFVVSATTFLRSRACRAVVSAASHGEEKRWNEISKEINGGQWGRKDGLG